jgi:hypothetical protein
VSGLPQAPATLAVEKGPGHQRQPAGQALIGGRGDFDRDLLGLAALPRSLAPAKSPRPAVVLCRPLLLSRAVSSSYRHYPTLCSLSAWIGSKDARDWPLTSIEEVSSCHFRCSNTFENPWPARCSWIAIIASTREGKFSDNSGKRQSDAGTEVLVTSWTVYFRG